MCTSVCPKGGGNLGATEESKLQREKVVIVAKNEITLRFLYSAKNNEQGK